MIRSQDFDNFTTLRWLPLHVPMWTVASTAEAAAILPATADTAMTEGTPLTLSGAYVTGTEAFMPTPARIGFQTSAGVFDVDFEFDGYNQYGERVTSRVTIDVGIASNGFLNTEQYIWILSITPTQIRSSGGQTVQFGLRANTAAVGQYGAMAVVQVNADDTLASLGDFSRFNDHLKSIATETNTTLTGLNLDPDVHSSLTFSGGLVPGAAGMTAAHATLILNLSEF